MLEDGKLPKEIEEAKQKITEYIESEEYKKLCRQIDESIQDIINKGQNIFKKLSYHDREALLSYISKILYEHAKDGGSYRYLIYDRFGFNSESYGVLQLSGLLDIHNLISGELKESCLD